MMLQLSSMRDNKADACKVIGSIIHSRQEWENTHKVTPLYRNIKRDGIPL